MEYIIIGAVSGVIASALTNGIITKHGKHKERREKQKHRLEYLRAKKAVETPLEICNQFANEQPKKQTVTCKGIYAEGLKNMLQECSSVTLK